MQRFIAELSRPIEKAEFERSWSSHESLDATQANATQAKVEFAFDGRRVSAVVHSDSSHQWPSVSFRQSFSAAIRRLDGVCNVRWL
jgi:hypothetical protein